MPKIQGSGQAEILSASDYEKMWRCFDSPLERTCFAIMRYTGERVGAIALLEVEDVWLSPSRKLPREEILFKGKNRKRSPQGKAKSRECPVCSALALELAKGYQPPPEGRFLPTPRTIDKWLRALCDRAGLGNRGISTHSFRRSLITDLSRKGVSARVIQRIVGHSSLALTQRYIETDPAEIARAIDLLE